LLNTIEENKSIYDLSSLFLKQNSIIKVMTYFLIHIHPQSDASGQRTSICKRETYVVGEE